MKPAPPVTTTRIRDVRTFGWSDSHAAGVEDVRRVLAREGAVEVIVVDEHHDRVGGRELLGRELDRHGARGELGEDDVRVGGPTSAPDVGEQLGDAPRRRLATVADVPLVRHPEQQDAAAA